MPTLLEDAQDVSAAMRNFADSLRDAAEPGDIYPMLGELLGTSRSLTAVFNRISVALADYRPQATDDQGNPEAGANAVQHTLIRLREARSLTVQLEAALDQASQSAGTIAWRAPAPAPAPAPQPPRYVNIVFFQGEEADRIIETITMHGLDAAFEQLTGHDHGDETLDAALENGYLYDQPPTGQLDQVGTRDVYTMVYNPFMGHVGLYREYDALPDPTLLGIEDPPAHAAAAVAQVRKVSRADRLGTPRVVRAAYPTRASLRGRGA